MGYPALSLLKLIEPYLFGDKREEARYVLNIGGSLPDTKHRPMYRCWSDKARRHAFLYPEYVDFSVKYAIVVHKGDKLPRPLRLVFPIKYTLDEREILRRKGIIRDP